MTPEPPTLWSRTAADLLAATSSHQPTPGGGSVAALSGAFGAALLHMAAVISRNMARKSGEDVPSALESALADLDTAQLRLRALADQDVAVFRLFMDATKLPKGTDAEKQARTDALAEAGEVARQTPLDIAHCCVAALDTARELLPVTHADIVSDVGAGAALLRGALDAALLTLDINLRHLEGGERAVWTGQRDDLTRRGHAAAEAVLEGTRERMARSNG